MKKAKLLKSVVFMPPADEVVDLDKEIRVAKPGTEVIVLDHRSMAVQVMREGLSKWIYYGDLEAIR
jgi:hypothetical protein